MKHTLDKFYIFGLPLLYLEWYDDKKIWKLLKFISIITIKEKPNKSSIKFLGIPVIKKKTKNYSSGWTYGIMKILSMLPTKRNAVLIMDNIFEPNANIVDNFTFFEYLYNSPTQKLKPYYILEERSPYYKQLKYKYKDSIIGFAGRPTILMKLKLLSIMPRLKYVCDSFQSISHLQLNARRLIKKANNIFSIFTQHGITYFKPDFIRPQSYGFKTFDYATVSNDIEKDIFITRGGFPESRIIKNGLFRWDKIGNSSSSTKEKFIFIFFTKRAYLAQVKDIKISKYFRAINKILSDRELKEALSKNNIKIKLGLHHSIAEKFKHYFENKDIELLSEDGIDVAKQEALMLLTDYSSMCFEFFLQNKPVVFYNINDASDCEFYGYREDVVAPYAGKENELFNIAADEKETIRLILKYIENNFKCEKEVLQKQAKFFYYRHDFCKRLEEFMLTHLNDKKKK